MMIKKLRNTLLLGLGLMGWLAAEKPSQPNILYLYVDDMGWGAIGPNGQDKRRELGLPVVKTPFLDQMAKDGLNFTRGYGAPVCSPARSSQQTGFHQGHTFADWNNPDNAKKAIRKEDLTMGDVLSQAGYVTGYWGKWGYGASKDQNDPVILNHETLPNNHGYTHILAELHHVRAHTFFQPTLWYGSKSTKGQLKLVPNELKGYKNLIDSVPEYDFLRDPSYPETAYCDDTYSLEVLKFVREQSQNYLKTGQPFFGLFAAQIPHAPFDEIAKLPKWDAAYAKDPHFKKLKQQSQQWAAMVTRIDLHIGMLLKALEDPNNDGDTSDSVAENTLVIFQSDNGGPKGASREEYDANGGLRDNKGSVYEGGIRVPTLMKWPAMINSTSKLKAGQNVDEVMCVTNLLPTFCDLAGVARPLGLDGMSMAPMLTGKGLDRKREFLIHEAGGRASIIRGDYKLIGPKSANSNSKKKKAGASAKYELYHLIDDHGEENNLADKEPELLKELLALMLGERVSEPAGFANTYHHWQGGHAGDIHSSENWSDYEYSNEGSTYMKVEGAPEASWTAHMVNQSEKPQRVELNKPLSVLGFELRGERAAQNLVVGSQGKLEGRNEIRVAAKSQIMMQGGTLSTLRWVDIYKEGRINGYGSIEGSLANWGRLDLRGILKVNGELALMPGSNMAINTQKEQVAQLKVSGPVQLSGRLALVGKAFETVSTGEEVMILSGDAVKGKFDLPNDVVSGPKGRKFKVIYTDRDVKVKLL